MVSLKEYREQALLELDVDETNFNNEAILISYELSNLTDAVYKLIDKIKKKEE